MIKLTLITSLLLIANSVLSKTLENQKKALIHRYFAALDGAKDSAATFKDILSSDFTLKEETTTLKEITKLENFVTGEDAQRQYHFPRIFEVINPDNISVVVHHQKWKSKKNISNLVEYNFKFIKKDKDFKIKDVNYKFLEKAPKSISPTSSIESNIWHANYYKNLK